MKYMHLGNGKGCEKQVACGRGGGMAGIYIKIYKYIHIYMYIYICMYI